MGARVLATLLVVCGLVALATAGTFKPPPLKGHVADTSKRLSELELSTLDRKLAAIRTRTGYAIVALVVGPIGDEPIEDVAYTAFNTWQVGDAGKDNGILIVIAPTERKVHIETGKGVGGVLTDLQTNEIITKTMGPLLALGKLDLAIQSAAAEIEAVVMKDAPVVKPLVKRPGMSTVGKGVLGGSIGLGIVTVVLLIVSPKARMKFGAGTRAFGPLAQLLMGLFKIIAAIAGGRGGKGSGKGGSGYSGGGGRSGGGGSSGGY